MWVLVALLDVVCSVHSILPKASSCLHCFSFCFTLSPSFSFCPPLSFYISLSLSMPLLMYSVSPRLGLMHQAIQFFILRQVLQLP